MTELSEERFFSEYADLCRRILSEPKAAYDTAGQLMGLVSYRLNLLPGAAYEMWAELTDVCELGPKEACQRSEELMREAAAEFLSLEDPSRDLPKYSKRWLNRILMDPALRW